MLMRSAILLVMVMCMAGCKGTTGPLANKNRNDRIDDPLLTIDEQQRRGRDRYAIPEDNQGTPNTLSNRYGPTGR
jgi:hypothetical protein